MGSNPAVAASTLVAVFAAGAIGAAPAVAQITLDGSMGTGGAIPLAGNTYSILQSYGQTRGSNLFHSFGAFGVPTGQTADFQGAGIRNIVARVTGGARSDIDGQIKSSIAGANLFLMNPAGIMFGPNASLNVSGSFHATTADYIGFANGDRFMANPSAAGSTLSIANPASFGFLGPNSGAITINGSSLSAPSLSLAAGSIDIHQDGVLPGGNFNVIATSGTMNVFTMQSAGTIGLDGTLSGSLGGTVSITNLGRVSAESTTGGNVNVVTGSLTLSGDSARSAQSFISAANLGAGASTGLVKLTADSITVDGVGRVTTQTAGTVGVDVLVNTRNLALTNGGQITTEINGSGAAGTITVNASGAMTVDGVGGVASNVFSGVYANSIVGATGQPGAINVNAANLAITNGAAISSDTEGSANAGNVNVTAGNLSLATKGVISSATSDAGNAGTVNVNAGNLAITSGGNITTSSFGSASGTAGDIKIAAGNIYLSGQDSYIQSQSLANNVAGKISVSANNLTILQDAAITTDTRTSFNAGSIDVAVTGALVIDGAGQTGSVTGITSDTVYDPPNNTVFVTGNAGNVTVNAGSITLKNSAQISSNANTFGNAGSVTVNAGSIVIDGLATSPDNFTGIASVANNPTNDPNIASRAGNVTINAGTLAILRNGQIATDTYTNGDAGTISVNVGGALLIDGAGQTTKTTGIFSDTFTGDGKAGTVNVSAGYGLLANNSKIATETGAGGRGGDIVATFATLDMNGGASISSASTGDATGNAGSVTVNSPGVITLYGAGTTIQSRAQGTGDAGPILVTADQLILKEGAAVTTEAAVGGGGNITMHLDFLLYLLRSSITTTVAGGTGSGGNIFIDPDFVVLNQSQILARAVGGNGGNIRIIAGQFLRSIDSVVDASSTLGISGQISISSPDTDVISGTVNLPTGLGSEAKLDQRACVGPGETPVLSLVPVGRGGLLLLPDASQSEPSFMLAGREAMDLPAQQTAQHRTAALGQFAALPMAASARNCAH